MRSVSLHQGLGCGQSPRVYPGASLPYASALTTTPSQLSCSTTSISGRSDGIRWGPSSRRSRGLNVARARNSKQQQAQDSDAPRLEKLDKEELSVLAEIPGKHEVDGCPKMRIIPVEEAVMIIPAESQINPDQLIENIHRVDSMRSTTAPTASVPGHRRVVDPTELDLIGDGLPIIRGEEWPEAYWRALESLSSQHSAPVPQPHPKFSMSDMARIAQQGPRFNDVVLEHAEREVGSSSPAEATAANAYSYIPYTVLGDWQYEVEPQWLRIPQMSILELYQGLRERNWTDRVHFKAGSEPWRLQLFQCGYSEGVTGWRGMRVVVTGADGSQRWVDMPEAGAPSSLDEHVLADPSQVGYRSVLTQLYQAFQQRLPPEALRELQRGGYVAPEHRGRYTCPADRLLDVSYHWAEGQVQSPLSQWLMSPQLSTAVLWVRHGIEESGIFELKALRDRLWFIAGPDLPRFEWTFDPNNAGPLYFLICLTLGVVVPALRRAKILDIRTLEEDPGAAQEFARSKADARKEGLTGVEFSDVAGLGPILNEVLEVVEFLKDPKTFAKLGARPPKGILLEGDPGTGKTLLAKALAGEAMVPFYQMSGTEFTEGIVGLGAARVRDLFKRSRANAPCVIFVDELDALGLKRAEGDGSGKVNEEREQTLNQLLTEMDGFEGNTGIIVIAATNRADILDPALLRPGRFDRQVTVDVPDAKGRNEILGVHARNKKLAEDVELKEVAMRTPGFAGADLANLLNEAAILAGRRGLKAITNKEIDDSIDRIVAGMEGKPLVDGKAKSLVAYHEVGHAICGTLTPGHDPVQKVTLIPRGQAKGLTWFTPGEDATLVSKSQIFARIVGGLGGRAAEEIVFGEAEVTSGAAGDLQQVSGMARQMVINYGMSDIGPWSLMDPSAMSGDVIMRMMARNSMSENLQQRIDEAVKRISLEAYDVALSHIRNNREAIDKITEVLLEKETMTGDEFRALLSQYTTIPEENLRAVEAEQAKAAVAAFEDIQL
mmetsp:Transcript_38914/g.86553  ORF Transcript_38914/g.86553 Transcript_38914/m.86553 type:complete len:1002 (+) Transcript_38914:196-3201(+)